MGLFIEEGEFGQHVTETFTCCHCNTVHAKRDAHGRRLDTAMCGRCFRPVCERCHAHGRCVPFEKKLDRFERRVNEQIARGITRRSMGI